MSKKRYSVIGVDLAQNEDMNNEINNVGRQNVAPTEEIEKVIPKDASKEETNDTTPIENEESVVKTTKTGMVDYCFNLKVRSLPDIEAPVIGILRKGERFDIIEVLPNDFVKINRKNRIGYISKLF